MIKKAKLPLKYVLNVTAGEALALFGKSNAVPKTVQ